MKRHILKSFVSGLASTPASGALILLASTAAASAQIIIGPRIVQPYVVHPRVIVQPPVIVTVPPPVIIRPPVVMTPRVVVVTPPVVVVAPTPVAAPQTVVTPAQTVETNDLQRLVAPIALYPDPLLSVVLPASTYPQQIGQAAQFAAANPAAPEPTINSQSWDPSVKALVHYPTVLQQLSGDPQWTESLGSAFSTDPAAVSRAIQDLRGRAIVVGSLVASTQIAIVQDAGVISIQPAVETALFVPMYNPLTIYDASAVLTWSPAYVNGPWLVNGYDWAGGAVFVGDWHGGYVVENHVWVRNRYFRVDHYHPWHHDMKYGPAPSVPRVRWSPPQAKRGPGVPHTPAPKPHQPTRTDHPKPAPAPVHTSPVHTSAQTPHSNIKEIASGSGAQADHTAHSQGGGGRNRR